MRDSREEEVKVKRGGGGGSISSVHWELHHQCRCMSDHLDNGGHLVRSVDWHWAPAAEQDAASSASAVAAVASSSCLGCATRHQLHERLSVLSRAAAPTGYLPRLTRANAVAVGGLGLSASPGMPSSKFSEQTKREHLQSDSRAIGPYLVVQPNEQKNSMKSWKSRIHLGSTQIRKT